MQKRSSIVCVALPLLLSSASCACPWERGQDWSFALSRDMLGDGSLAPPSSWQRTSDPHPASASGAAPYRGGWESLWMVPFVAGPLGVLFAFDIVLLPITAPHDLFFG